MYSLEIPTMQGPEWSALMQEFDDASIYQTWSCGAALWGAQRLSHLVLRCGEEVFGLAQVAAIQAPLFRAGTALVFWGPLWQRHGKPRDTEICAVLMAALRDEFVEKRGMLLRIIPHALGLYGTDVRAAAETAGFQWKGCIYRTYLLDISQPPGQIRKHLRSNWRNHLKQAEQKRLTVTRGTGLERYDIFYGLFAEMQRQKQFTESSFDPVRLRAIQQDLPDRLKTQIFLCSRDEEPVAGAVVSAAGDTAILLLAASSREGRTLKASYFLQWKVIEWLQSQGVRFYDLGGTKHAIPGVNHFKEGLGGKDVCHAGLFELCRNTASSLFDRSLGIMRSTFDAR